ncbi:MAG: type II secretion system F family protein [Granulosicoccus sp.]
MRLLVIQMVLFVSFSLLVYLTLKSAVFSVENYSKAFSRTTESSLRKLFIFADTRKLSAAYGFGLLIFPLVLWLSGAGLVVVLAAVLFTLLAPYKVIAHLAAKRESKIKAALPDALSQISGAMRAGSTFSNAVESYTREAEGALGQEFSLLLREQRMGTPLDEALENLAERIQSEEIDLFASAAMIANEVGGNLAEILSGLSETLRRKIEMEGKIDSLTAQGRLQGRVVSALPFLILLPLIYFEPEATYPIFTSLLGWCFLLVIVTMDFIGSVLIKKIVSIDI